MKLDRDFENTLNVLRIRYGESFEYLNGFHETQLDFSDFINGFVDKKVADVTIDANANASHKDIVSMNKEKGKSQDKLFAFNKIFYEIKKKYGLRTAKMWLESEYTGLFYLHDSHSSTYLPYCFAYDLTRLATEGLFFLSNYNNQAPQHLTTFTDDVIEYISYMCNRSSGAVGIPNILIWTFYFWKHDIEHGYYIKNPDYYIRQTFQKFIYRMNQPFLRTDQSAFVNVSIFDRNYVESLFGGVQYPDGTFVIDYVEELIEHQKVFMEVVSQVRSENMFTFPVLTYSLLYRDGKFVDEDFARWCSDHNVTWNDSNFFISGDVNTLSNCCFDKNQKVLVNIFDKAGLTTFSEIEKMPTEMLNSLKVFHNGNWAPAKFVKLPARKMYRVVTINNKEMVLTDNHLNPTLHGDIKTEDLTINDYLMFNTRTLDESDIPDMDYNYNLGLWIGKLLINDFTYDEDSITVNASEFFDMYTAPQMDLDALKKDCFDYIDPECTITTSMIDDGMIELKLTSKAIRDQVLQYINWIDGNKFLNANVLTKTLKFRGGIINGLMSHAAHFDRIFADSKEMVDSLEALFTAQGIYTVVDETESISTRHGKYQIRIINTDERVSDGLYKTYNNSIYFKIKSIEEIKDYNEENVYCFEMVNKDEPYFTLPNGIITHNCRLLSDTSKLSAFINSIGGTALSIGSVKVNTINLMRIAYNNKTEYGIDTDGYLKELREAAILCCKTLDTIRHIIRRNIEKGLLPNYQDGGVELDKQYCTVGILGMYEVIRTAGLTYTDELGNIYYSEEGIEFASKIFEVLNDVKDNFTNEYSFNIESVPAERAAVILCQKDNELFELRDNPEFIYSNQWIPLSAKCTLKEKLHICSILDEKCSGGSIAHINLESNFPNTDVAWDMLNKIAQSGVIYFAFNTRINECKNHHGFVGTDICPVCGEPVFDTYQRIVGYLVPTRSYSKDRFREFNTRNWYEYAQEMKVMME